MPKEAVQSGRHVKRLRLYFVSKRIREATGDWLVEKKARAIKRCSYPSPSRVMAVSAKTRRTSPTVVLALQSIPNKQLSSASCRPVQDTTTRYRVLPG